MAQPHWDLIVPFYMRSLTVIDDDSVTLFDLDGTLTCANQSRGKYRLKLASFESERDALEALPRVLAALLWTAATLQEPIQVPDSVACVQYLDHPKSLAGLFEGAVDNGPPYVDGLVDGEGAFAKPHAKQVSSMEGSKVTLVHHLRPGRFAEALDSSRVLSCPEQLARDPRLLLANDLYSAALDAPTPEARVVSFCTVIESLLDERPASTPVAAAVDATCGWIRAERSAHDRGSPEREAFSDVIQALSRLKKLSVSKRFAAVGSTFLQDASLEPQLKAAYKARSALVHDGRAPAEEVASAEDSLRLLVPRILLAAYERVGRT
jgi:hypothetical protein